MGGVEVVLQEKYCVAKCEKENPSTTSPRKKEMDPNIPSAERKKE
jgi:hypothetical protein